MLVEIASLDDYKENLMRTFSTSLTFNTNASTASTASDSSGTHTVHHTSATFTASKLKRDLHILSKLEVLIQEKINASTELADILDLGSQSLNEK